jgi:hypothetical protein
MADQEVHVSPIGRLVYPFLQTPRAYKRGGQDGAPAYDCKLVLDGAAAAQFASQIDDWMQAAVQQFPGLPADATPYSMTIDEAGQPVPGSITVKFRVVAETKKKDGTIWDRKPAIVDANGDPIGDAVLVGTGSRARLSFDPYLRKAFGKAGVSLQPRGAQIVDLIERKPSARSLGFEKVEGGFTAGSNAGAPASGPPPTDGEHGGDF